MKILRVNMKDSSIIYQDLNEDMKHLGGRALISYIMLNEVNPWCNPLGDENKIIVASGILAGTTVSCVNRISIGGKSPLTGTIKESNAGGTTSYRMARLGLRAIVLEDQPMNDNTYILYIEKGKTELIEANEFKHLGIYETAEILKKKYNDKIGLVAIGPAGEKLYQAAGIANMDNDGVPSRFSGRGGLGAVMGSKGIKAIVINDKEGEALEISNEELFNATRKTISNTIVTNDAIANSYTKFGTANLVNLTNSIGALPTRNFSNGSFEGKDNINGQTLYDLITQRGGEGKPSHACMPGCLIRCSNIFPDESGKAIVSPIEYETIGLLGSNLAIDNFDDICRMNYICNDLGLDTIEIGGALGVAMEAGVLEFGDGKGAIATLESIKEDSILGKVIGQGAAVTGSVFGVRRVPVAKNQTMAAYDPRAIKGLGVTYATSTQGADHTAGQTLRAPVEHTKAEGQVAASRNAQISNTMHDCIGTCFFVGGAIKGEVKLLSDLYTAMCGEVFSPDDFTLIAKETLLREREFNKRAGFTSSDDRLAEFFYKEKNPVTNTVFDVSQDEMDELFNF